MTKPLYIETRIEAPIETVWERTQDPQRHERWDLRFTEIEFLPRTEESELQRFRYATRLGFGIGIEGYGETVTSKSSEFERTSVLKFGSNDPRSLIRDGSGYWKYRLEGTESSPSVRFSTGYDYRVRFGSLGRMFDMLVFRPLVGWATAWSFDRLRRWIEDGRDPQDQLRLALSSTLCRFTVTIAWLWLGLNSSLITDSSLGDVSLVDSRVEPDAARDLVLATGMVEFGFAACVIYFWKSKTPLIVTAFALLLLTIASTIDSSFTAREILNLMTFNLQVALLAIVALVLGRDLPSASNCLRERSTHASSRS